MAKAKYDFLVIGTIKAATTTLHYLLADHPEISLPREKEAPLFVNDVTVDDVARHVEEFTGGKPATRAGKVTPLYMCLPDVAPRIHSTMPEVKLIAMVRDPVARARSHWRMRCNWGKEHRTFSQVVQAQLEDSLRWRRTGVEEDGYVADGEYGRILSEYRSLFPAEQLLVIESAELQRSPLPVLERISDFLGVVPHSPSELGREYNVSERQGKRSAVSRWLWRFVSYDWALKVTGPALQRRAGELLDRAGITRPQPRLDPGLPDLLLKDLQSHYLTDAKLLPSGIDVDVWNWKPVADQPRGGSPHDSIQPVRRQQRAQ